MLASLGEASSVMSCRIEVFVKIEFTADISGTR